MSNHEKQTLDVSDRLAHEKTDMAAAEEAVPSSPPPAYQEVDPELQYNQLPQTGYMAPQAPPPAGYVTAQAPPPAGYMTAQAPPPAGYITAQAPPQAGYVTAQAPPQAGYVTAQAPPPAGYMTAQAPAPAEYIKGQAPPPAGYMTAQAPPPAGYMMPPTQVFYPTPYGQPMCQTVPGNVQYVPAPQAQTMNVTQGEAPKDYFNQAIFVTLCCFWPTGIMAIRKASDARAALARGELASARKKSQSAWRMIKISFIIGFLFIGLVCILLIAQL